MDLSRIEIKRRMFHLVSGLFLVGLISYNILDFKVAFVLLIIAFILSFAAKKMNVPLISWFLKKFDRPRDYKRFPGKGSVFYLVGVFLVLLLFLSFLWPN